MFVFGVAFVLVIALGIAYAPGLVILALGGLLVAIMLRGLRA